MRIVAALAFGHCLLTTACGGGDLALPEDQSPADITAVGGNGQSGLVGTELSSPLIVKVVDAQGRPVEGVQVAFELGAGAEGGAMAPDTAITNAKGEASANWILGGGTGTHSVAAIVVGATLSVTFSAQAERGSELTLELVSGDDQEGRPGQELSQPLVVRLVDEEGDGVSGRAVSWVVATGGGEAGPVTSNTDGDGFAATTWTLGDQAGPQTLNAVVSGVGVISFTATAGDGGGSGPSASRSSIDASPASIPAVTGQSTITVTVRDGQGDPVAGAAVTLLVSGSGNVLVQPSGLTGENGVATGTLQSLVAETKVVTAVVDGNVTLVETAQVVVTLVPSGPDHLVFRVPPADVEEREDFSPPIEVAVVDQQGNVVPVSGIEVELKLLESDGRDSHDLHGDRTRATSDGIAVFPDLHVHRDDDDYRMVATAPGRPELGAVESPSFDVED